MQRRTSEDNISLCSITYLTAVGEPIKSQSVNLPEMKQDKISITHRHTIRKPAEKPIAALSAERNLCTKLNYLLELPLEVPHLRTNTRRSSRGRSVAV